MELPPALYVPADDGWAATALTIGPWDPGLQHAGPPAALLLREAERAGAIDGGQTVRLAFDILGPVPVGPGAGRAPRCCGPGRRIELVEAVLCGADGRPLMRLTAWRMRVRDDGPDRGAPAAPTAGMPAGAGGQPRRGRRLLQRPRWPTTGPWSGGSPPAASTPPGRRRPGPGRACDAGRGRADDAAGAPAGDDRRRQRHLRGAGLDHRHLRQRRPQRRRCSARRAGEWLGMDAATHLGGTRRRPVLRRPARRRGFVGRSAHALFVEPR